MPVRQINPARSPERDALLRSLVAEWERPTDAAGAPVILEESRAPDRAVHVYVVWDAWGGLSRADRHEVVMDAAEKVKSLDDLMRITQAWALLPDEADRLKVPWRDGTTASGPAAASPAHADH